MGGDFLLLAILTVCVGGWEATGPLLAGRRHGAERAEEEAEEEEEEEAKEETNLESAASPATGGKGFLPQLYRTLTSQFKVFAFILHNSFISLQLVYLPAYSWKYPRLPPACQHPAILRQYLPTFLSVSVHHPTNKQKPPISVEILCVIT